MAEKEDEQEKAKSKSGAGSKTLIIILLAAFLLFIMAAGAGFFVLWKRLPSPEKAKTEMAQNGTEEEKSGELTMGPVFTLEPFVVNLGDPEGNRFLRTKISLELQNEELIEKMDKFRFPVRDSILTILSAKQYKDINTVQGKQQLRTEIVTRVEGLLGKESVKNVYFSDFVAE